MNSVLALTSKASRRATALTSMIPSPGRAAATTATTVINVQQQHCFSTAPAVSWSQKKLEAKNRRRELYELSQQRKERLKTRRQGAPVNEKKRAFRAWFIQKKVNDEYMTRKARQAGLDWKLNVAVILERMNVVLPDKEDWEVEYENLSSHLAQFGRDYPKGLIPAAAAAYDPEFTDEQLLTHLKSIGFEPASRETEADKSGNVRTTDRKLKTSIFLTVKDKDGKWQLPTVPLLENETILEAAKRAIPEKAGKQLAFWCPSNCPVAVDIQAFPEDQRKSGFYGTKTFFMKVQYDEGAVEEKTVEDYGWLDRSEVVELIQKQQGDQMSNLYRYML